MRDALLLITPRRRRTNDLHTDSQSAAAMRARSACGRMANHAVVQCEAFPTAQAAVLTFVIHTVKEFCPKAVMIRSGGKCRWRAPDVHRGSVLMQKLPRRTSPSGINRYVI